MFDYFFSILGVFLAVGCGFVLLLLIIGSFCPSFFDYLVLLCAIRSGRYAVRTEGEDEEQTITLLHEGETGQSEKWEEEFSRKSRELSGGIERMQSR